MKIKKLLTIKIISIVVLAVFIFLDPAYGLAVEASGNLRIRLDDPQDDERIQTALILVKIENVAKQIRGRLEEIDKAGAISLKDVEFIEEALKGMPKDLGKLKVTSMGMGFLSIPQIEIGNRDLIPANAALEIVIPFLKMSDLPSLKKSLKESDLHMIKKHLEAVKNKLSIIEKAVNALRNWQFQDIASSLNDTGRTRRIIDEAV